jgi:glycosyltransferase involved in cell wall biosynthesis
MPKISVIVPVYNVAPFLRAALDSILAQTFRDLQVIIVDDGSTDACPEMLRDFSASDERVQLMHLERNFGYGHAVNIGLERAEGEYVHIFESDDELYPHFYEKMLTATDDTGADVVSCLHDVVTESGDLIKHSRRRHDPNKCLLTVDKDHYLLHNRIGIWSLLIRRSLIVENHVRLHESAGASFQDIGFYYQIVRSCHGIFQINEPLYRYREHPGQSIKSKFKGLSIFHQYDFLLAHVIDKLSGDEKNRSKGMLDGLIVQKLVRQGLHCEISRKEEYIEALLETVRNMDPILTELYLTSSRLGISLYRLLRRDCLLSVREFIRRRKSKRRWKFGFFYHAESLLYRCLIAK